MKFTLFSLFLFWMFPCLLHAQLIPELPGARVAALAMGGVTISDLWAIQHNIGALGSGDLEKPAIAFSSNSRLMLTELTTIGTIAAIPFKHGILGASVTRFGLGVYSLTSAGLGFSHQVKNVSVGIKLNYLQQSIEGFISQGTIVIEAGGKIQLLPELHFGGHAYNLSQSSFSGTEASLVPVILKAGLEYTPGKAVLLLVQTLKEVDTPARLSTAMEYKLKKTVLLRTGLQTKPLVASFGIGFHINSFGFDYAFRHHTTIGVVHHFTVGISLPKSKQK